MFNGQLGGANGGVQAGDAACTREAMTAGRSGTFHALLSTAGASAVDRIAAGPWKLSDQTPVPSKASFGAGGVLINRDASGGVVAHGDKVWTGSNGAGGPDPLSCAGWTDGQGVGNGRAGSVGGAGQAWISSDNQPCSDSRPIYCFQD